jgi:hypothetical protein
LNKPSTSWLSYRPHFIGEAVKGVSQAITASVILLVVSVLGYLFLTSGDFLEYRKLERKNYISAAIANNSLSVTSDGKKIEKLSVVEFGIYNRSDVQFHDVELTFLIDSPSPTAKFLSVNVIPDKRVSFEHFKAVTSSDSREQRFSLKVVPRSTENHWSTGSTFDKAFHFVFLFEGDVPPEIQPLTLSKGVKLIEYREWRKYFNWKTITVAILWIFALAVGFWIARRLKMSRSPSS